MSAPSEALPFGLPSDIGLPSDMVSAHGGHSREFCSHARGPLDEIVARYSRCGFAWAALTEHMPAVSDRFLYPEELRDGLDAADTRQRFERFVVEARQLQRDWADRLRLFVGLECEAYTGAIELARDLTVRHQLDYVVGSVHHVDDLPIDTSQTDWLCAAEQVGGVEQLYLLYFDHQLEVIERLRPAVVGHFDLVRLHDPDYRERLASPAIRLRAERNLERIAALGLCLDVNSRAFAKGQDEPFPCRPLLEMALDLGIRLLPGDDSHSAADVAGGYERTLALLEELGLRAPWPDPLG